MGVYRTKAVLQMLSYISYIIWCDWRSFGSGGYFLSVMKGLEDLIWFPTYTYTSNKKL